MEERKRKLRVVKANSLVQAKYRLSVQEQRLILLAISQINRHEELTDQKMYSISAKDMSDLTNTSLDQTYEDLKKAALKLKRREVTIYEAPNSEGFHDEILVANWVQTIKYVKKQGKVEVRFNHDIVPYLNQVKINKSFTEFLLNGPTHELFRMNSSYGYRIFELLMQWNCTGVRTVELKWLKSIFLIEDKYPRIKDFKNRVLEPAIQQINNTTNLWIEWDQKKTGRKVTHFIFTFGLKNEDKPKKLKKKPTKSDLQDPKFLSKHGRPGESTPEVIRRLKEQFEI